MPPTVSLTHRLTAIAFAAIAAVLVFHACALAVAALAHGLTPKTALDIISGIPVFFLLFVVCGLVPGLFFVRLVLRRDLPLGACVGLGIVAGFIVLVVALLLFAAFFGQEGRTGSILWQTFLYLLRSPLTINVMLSGAAGGAASWWYLNRIKRRA